MGGLIGMVLAALPGSPVRRIVINDIGPYLPWAGLLRLGANPNEAPKDFETIRAAELYLRRVWLRSENWKTSIGVIWRFTAWNGSQSGSATSHCVIPVLRTHSGILGTIA